MRTRGSLVCPSCRYANEDDARLCSVCGSLFVHAERAAPALHLALGAGLALLLHFFTCGIMDSGVHLFTHECLGHAATAWLLGRWAIPGAWMTSWALEPSLLLRAIVLLALAGGAWKCWQDDRRSAAIGLGVGALVYPLLAFTSANELLVIAGGQGGEIFWGAFFFYRATRGGFFQEHERPLYAALGWILWVGNVVLFFKLATNGSYRAYYESISLVEGTDNDYVRVAALLHAPLARVSAFMVLPALLGPPLGAYLGFAGRRPAAPGGWRAATSAPSREPS